MASLAAHLDDETKLSLKEFAKILDDARTKSNCAKEVVNLKIADETNIDKNRLDQIMARLGEMEKTSKSIAGIAERI